jgi:hypothetical protein
MTPFVRERAVSANENNGLSALGAALLSYRQANGDDMQHVGFSTYFAFIYGRVAVPRLIDGT